MNTAVCPGVPMEIRAMFNLFKKKDPREQVMKEYRILLEEAHRLSTSDRRASDLKRAEAEALLDRFEKGNQKG
jgi:hypothetical protein